mgnify:CR=1 FL=1
MKQPTKESVVENLKKKINTASYQSPQIIQANYLSVASDPEDLPRTFREMVDHFNWCRSIENFARYIDHLKAKYAGGPSPTLKTDYWTYSTPISVPTPLSVGPIKPVKKAKPPVSKK